MPSSSTFLLRGVIGEDVVTGLKLRMIWFWTSPTTLASITVRAAKVIRQWVIDKLPNDQASWNWVTKSKTSCGHWPLSMFSPSHSCLCCILLPGVHWQCPDPIELTPMAFDDWPSDSGWTDRAEQQLGSEPCNHWVDVKHSDSLKEKHLIQANKWIRNWKGEKLLVLRLSQKHGLHLEKVFTGVMAFLHMELCFRHTPKRHIVVKTYLVRKRYVHQHFTSFSITANLQWNTDSLFLDWIDKSPDFPGTTMLGSWRSASLRVFRCWSRTCQRRSENYGWKGEACGMSMAMCTCRKNLSNMDEWKLEDFWGPWCRSKVVTAGFGSCFELVLVWTGW